MTINKIIIKKGDNVLKMIILWFLIVCQISCATIISGRHQDVTVKELSNSQEAIRCIATNGKSTKMFTPPASIEMRRTGASINITCKNEHGDVVAEGYSSSDINMWISLDILWLFFWPVAFTVDAMSGSINKYDSEIVLVPKT